MDVDKVREQFGKRARSVRESKGKTQFDYAVEKKVNLKSLSGWENGKNITLDSLVKLCNANEIYLDEFFSEGFEPDRIRESDKLKK